MVSIKNLKYAIAQLLYNLAQIRQLETYYIANNESLTSSLCGVPLTLFVLGMIPNTLTRCKMTYNGACLGVN